MICCILKVFGVAFLAVLQKAVCHSGDSAPAPREMAGRGRHALLAVLKCLGHYYPGPEDEAFI